MQEVEGSTPTGGTWPNDFSDPIDQGILTKYPFQTGKTVHVHAKHYKLNEDGRTAPGVCGNGSVQQNHSGNVVTRIGIHTHIDWKILSTL